MLLNRIFQIYRDNLSYKYVYLYNELFISLNLWESFCLYWISLKSDNLIINKYTWEETKIWDLLNLIIEKHKSVFLFFLRYKRQGIYRQWEEAEFINIFDKRELLFGDIQTIFTFTFVDDYSYRRKIPDNFNIEHSILGIYHSDYECSICNWYKDAFTNFADYSKVFDQNFFHENTDKSRHVLYTNITDYESITLWWNEKINSILSDQKLLQNYDIISLNQTCISVIMWDDPKSLFEYNKIPINKRFLTNQETDSNYKTLIKFLMNIRVQSSDIQPSNHIIFFWLNKNKNTLELIQFLKGNFNIIVDKILIPNINVKDIESILNYSLAIFFTWREIKAQKIFTLYPICQFESPVPYGITRNRELIKNIFLKMWKEEDIGRLDAILEKYTDEHKGLYDEARKYGLWFIIHSFHIKQFMDDNFRWVPILSFLKDMWFQLHFFIYSSGGHSDLDLEPLKEQGVNIIISDQKEDLDSFIDDDRISCYYSEIANDKRIIGRGKQQFSVWDFEYGIEWFYRTLQLLIRKCEKWKYYQELNIYLK